MNQSNHQHRILAYISASVYAVLIGGTFLATKIGVKSGSPLETLSYRFLFAFIGLFLIIKIKGIKLSYRGKPWGRLLITSILYVVLFFGFQAFGMVFITTVEGSIIFAMVPVLTLLLATFFLKEKHNWKQYVSVVLSTTGILLILLPKTMGVAVNSWMGIFMVMLSSVALAAYSVCVRGFRNAFTPIEISFFMILSGVVFYQGLLLGTSVYTKEYTAYTTLLSKGPFLLSTLYLGFFTTCLTSLLSNYGLSKLPAVQISIFSNLATLIGIVLGVVFLGETVTYYHVVGTVLIIGGVLGTNFLASKNT